MGAQGIGVAVLAAAQGDNIILGPSDRTLYIGIGSGKREFALYVPRDP